MIFRFLVLPQTVPNFDDKRKQKTYCNKIIEVLNDEELMLSKFREALDFLTSDKLGLDFGDRKTPERKNTTDMILLELKNKFFIKN
jgi:hypothetical protein